MKAQWQIEQEEREAQRVAKIERENQEREQAWAREEEHKQGMIELAKQTGEKQIIREYSAPCNDRREECDIDNITVFANPDGTTETVRRHSW